MGCAWSAEKHTAQKKRARMQQREDKDMGIGDFEGARALYSLRFLKIPDALVGRGYATY